MTLQDQLTSVELSNRLHQLGVVAPSIFYRDSTCSKENEILKWENKDGDYCPDNVNCYSVAELGEMLPERTEYIKTRGTTLHNIRCLKRLSENLFVRVIIAENIEEEKTPWFSAKTEANARAKMLVYLLENKLLNL